MKITLKITFTSEKIFSSSTTTLEIVQEHFNINIFLRFIFSVECKCFCTNSAACILNTIENRAISLVKSSRDNESSRTDTDTCSHTPTTTTEEHYGTYIVKLDVKYPLANPIGFYATIEASSESQIRNTYSEYMTHATQQYRT
jgi:hypothetical protein